MEEYKFFKYFEETNKLKIYINKIHNYFEYHYNIIIETIDFDQNQNVILYIENKKSDITTDVLEKLLLNDINHLNDIEIKNMKIILTFDCKEIEIF